MRVLLAVDSSKFSDEAARQVFARPWPANTQVLVLSVVDELADNLIHEAEAAAVASADLAVPGSCEVERIVELGDPQSRIVERARQWGADFIFVGSHGHSALTRFLLGSVSRYVVHKANCSVAVVRAHSSSGSAQSHGLRVMLATDGSQACDEATRSIAARPWPDGTNVLILNAFGAHTTGRDKCADPRALATMAIDRAAEALQPAGLQIERATLPGDPREVILDHAREWDADLIVVGSHGWRGIDRLLLGSVSEAVAANAHCTVEVIRRKVPGLS